MPAVIEPEICKEGGRGSILPVWDTEWELHEAVRVLMYGCGLIYFFVGVSIVSDIFMGAIEVITSKKVQKMSPSGQIITAHVWNDTVANLSLMALGSSAPEILLAVTELLGNKMYAGELGPATIVGSASFNLLMIVALCIFIIPSTEKRKVQQVPVFFVTAIFMIVAYTWLVIIVALWTPDIIDIWEALVTLLLLPVLVFFSYLADIEFFGSFGKTLEVRNEDVDKICELLGQDTKETREAIRMGLAQNNQLVTKIESPSSADMSEFRKMVKRHMVTKKSRATHRIEATRALTGGKKIQWESEPTFTDVVHVCGLSGACIQDVPLALPKGSGKAQIQFTTETQSMSDCLLEKTVTFHRTGDCSAPLEVFFDVIAPSQAMMDSCMSFNPGGRASLVSALSDGISGRGSRSSKTSRSSRSSFSGGLGGGRMSVSGTSATGEASLREKRNSGAAGDFDIQNYVCNFAAGEDISWEQIRPPAHVSCDGTPNKFAIELNRLGDQDGSVEVAIGHIKRTLVVMRDPDARGQLSFASSRILVQGSPESQIMQILVQRLDGCQGAATCSWRTERLTAVPGFDFTDANGVLEFSEGVTEAVIEVEILPTPPTRSQDSFLIFLEDIDGAEFNPNTDGGIDAEILTVEIGPHDLMNLHFSDKMVRWFDERFNFNEIRLGNQEFIDQFASAVFCNGSYEEQQEASAFDWAFHIIALPWKLLFMFVPPAAYCGGWVCFYLSLLFIAGLTSFIGDLAELFGCVVGMPNLLTAISIVALGTSMPDLFASKAAATQDPTADASIVNVFGSNSVNVYLGLGLPWSIGAIYWNFIDWDLAWEEKYPKIALDHKSTGHMVFVVPAGDLIFSVMIFFVCAVTAIAIMMVRRRKIGAELGGPMKLKLSASVAFVVMWFDYVGLSGWWSLRQNEASGVEKLAVFVLGGSAIGVPAIIFLLIAMSMPVHSGWELEQTAVVTEEAPVRSNTHYHGRGQKTMLKPSSTKDALGCQVRESTASSVVARGNSSISIGSANSSKASQVNKLGSDSVQNGSANSDGVGDQITVEVMNDDSPKKDNSEKVLSGKAVGVRIASDEKGIPDTLSDPSVVSEHLNGALQAKMASSMYMARSITPGVNFANTPPDSPNVGIVSVQRGIGLNGSLVQQFSA